MMFIIRAGLQILADHPRLYLNSGSRPDSEWLRLRGPVPADRRDSNDPETVWTAKEDAVALPKHLGIPGFRHSIGLARWWHFSFDLLWLVNGALFYVLLFSTDEWKRLIPTSRRVPQRAVDGAAVPLAQSSRERRIQHLQRPAVAGVLHYGVHRRSAGAGDRSAAGPVGGRGDSGQGAGLLNRQVARSVHFGVLLWMLMFIAVHTLMIFVTGFVGNVNHMTLGTDTNSWRGVALYVAWMAVVVAFWLVASR